MALPALAVLTDYGDFVAFKGLPYAEPPERFGAPQPKRPWPSNETLDATRFRDACIHGGAHRDTDPTESFGESEDCLYANVWASKAKREGLLPVVVWIHGGGFVKRSGSYPSFWGDGFVTDPEAPAILVTFNYRLGIFGFFSWEGAQANLGFRDQQLLLRWVQENIQAFGGDPGRVLLMGQSAGAMSVLCHIAAPGSAGLFHKAMANSPVGLFYRSRPENDEFVRSVARAVLCFGANVTSCLLRRPAFALRDTDIAPEYLRHLTAPWTESANMLAWMPILDAETLPLNPLDAMQQGKYNKVPTILSSVTNETLAFVPTELMRLGNNWPSYHETLRIVFRERADKVAAHYAASPDSSALPPARRAAVVTTDALMTCYARYAARALAARSETYLSTFMLQPHSSQMHLNSLCVEGPPAGASCHAADVLYQIPTSPRMTQRTKLFYATDAESKLARHYTRAIIQFVSGRQSDFVRYNASEVDAESTVSEEGSPTFLADVVEPRVIAGNNLDSVRLFLSLNDCGPVNRRPLGTAASQIPAAGLAESPSLT
ncbi:cryS [Symbiodinium sp. KB8]|nr:cryS [Symbiodinium sp. KB8]